MAGDPVTVAVAFDAADQVVERMYPNGRSGGLLVDGEAPALVGSFVVLALRIGAPPASQLFTLKAQLAWARHKGAGRLQPCYGLDLVPGQDGVVKRLLAFLHGDELERTLRVEDRLHVALPVKLTHHERERKEQLADLSVGGAYLRTETPLPPGTEVALHLRPPGSLRKLHLTARVVWARTHGGAPGMGLQFLFADEEESDRLKKLVKKLRPA